MPLDGQTSLNPQYGRPQQLVADIAATVQVRDPVLRNLQITQLYHELAIALADQYGSRDITWCGFAKWTSCSVGRFLRGQTLHSVARKRLERFLNGQGSSSPSGSNARQGLFRRLVSGVHTRLDPLFTCVESIDDQVRCELARGNLLVFEELAPLFAKLLAALQASPVHDPAVREAFVSELDPRPFAAGGQELLLRAFRHYYDLAFERDDKRRAEFMLLANLLVARHEQARLQVVIDCASTIPSTQLKALRSRLFSDLLDAQVARALQKHARKQLMTLDLPNASVDLGEDVPPLFNGEMFPRSLVDLHVPELRDLITELDRTPDTTAGSAALNWTAISDRMNYVADLFRSRQQDLALYRAPFCLSEMAMIQRGIVPEGL